jgi:hypothetical protein
MAIARINITAAERQPNDFAYLAELVDSAAWRAARELRRACRQNSQYAELTAPEGRLLMSAVQEARGGTAARLLPYVRGAVEQMMRAEAEEAARPCFVSAARAASK